MGSILSNLLLILGMCFFFGGMRYREQVGLLKSASIVPESNHHVAVQLCRNADELLLAESLCDQPTPPSEFSDFSLEPRLTL